MAQFQTRKSLSMKRIEVENCIECPFMWDGRELEDVVRCIAKDLGDSFRELTAFRRWTPGHPAPPPRWCPLRKQEHLVMLRVR